MSYRKDFLLGRESFAQEVRREFHIPESVGVKLWLRMQIRDLALLRARVGNDVATGPNDGGDNAS